jgi:hypothetical protein
VIDFDEVRLGDPNLDLAHFCANFYLLAYRKNSLPAQFARLQHRFLETYALHSGWSLDERFVFFYAYSCLKLAKQLCKKRGPRPFPEGEEQRAGLVVLDGTHYPAAYNRNGITASVDAASTDAASGCWDSPDCWTSQERRTKWSKAARINKSDTSSAATASLTSFYLNEIHLWAAASINFTQNPHEDLVQAQVAEIAHACNAWMKPYGRWVKTALKTFRCCGPLLCATCGQSCSF